MTANPIVIEPYPHRVEIKRNGATLAESHLGFYTSTFDRVVVDGVPAGIDEAARSTDTRMQAKPTVDRTVAARLG